LRLTARTVASLGVGDYTDSDVQGLTLRVREAVRSWAVRFSVKQGTKRGPQRRITLGAFDGPLAVDLGALDLSDFDAPKMLTLEGARIVARALVGLAARGIDPAEVLTQADRAREALAAEDVRRATVGTVSLGALVDRMIDARTDLRPATLRNWRQLARTAIVPLRALDPATLTARDVRRWHKSSGATGKRVMANRALELLTAVYRWAMETEDEAGEPLLSSSPCAGIKPFPEPARERVLTSDELRAAWNVLDVEPFGDAVRLILWTAARHGEAAGAEWAEIDLRARLWTVPADRTKTATSHRVPLSSPAVAMLTARRTADPTGKWIFPSRRAAIGPLKSLQSTVTRVQVRSHTSGWTVHDLRRTARTGLSSIGVRPEIGEFCLGHKVGGIRGVYDRFEPLAEAASALEAWARRLASIASGEPEADNVAAFVRPA
jgi:integrase